jgi:hypothetical protein
VTNRSAALSLLNHVSCFVRKRLSHSSVGIEGLALYRVPLTTYRLESLSAQVGGAGVEPPGKTPVAVKRDARVGWFSLIGTDGSNPSSSSEESCELRYGRRRPADQVVEEALQSRNGKNRTRSNVKVIQEGPGTLGEARPPA